MLERSMYKHSRGDKKAPLFAEPLTQHSKTGKSTDCSDLSLRLQAEYRGPAIASVLQVVTARGLLPRAALSPHWQSPVDSSGAAATLHVDCGHGASAGRAVKNSNF